MKPKSSHIVWRGARLSAKDEYSMLCWEDLFDIEMTRAFDLIICLFILQNIICFEIFLFVVADPRGDSASVVVNFRVNLSSTHQVLI